MNKSYKKSEEIKKVNSQLNKVMSSYQWERGISSQSWGERV